ncbi:MAG: translation elongation factor Ts [bacterium]|nr:translation elongation factor Ts [bacterium]
MNINKELIQQLRETTGVGIMDAKKALEETKGDIDKAIELMKKQGQKVAAKKQDRDTNEGTIGTYIHSNGKVVGIAAVACESDFVGNTEDFKALAHDIAMQVAAADPIYISPDDVPADVLAKEKEIFTEQLKAEKKPAKVMDNILKGKVEKYYSEVCLLKQQYIKDDKLSIEQLIQEKVLKLGENIQVKEIKKISL